MDNAADLPLHLRSNQRGIIVNKKLVLKIMRELHDSGATRAKGKPRGISSMPPPKRIW